MDDLIYRGSVKTKVSDTWWDEIDSIPAVDAVEVVRCRECKYNAQPPDKGFAQCELDALIREPEFWCRAGARKDGQRREEGDA